MDLKAFYQKLRKIETEIIEPFVIIASKETPDGGRPGVLTEVGRRIAARMIAEGVASLAEEAEVSRFRAEISAARREAEQQAIASKLQVTVVTEGKSKKAAGQQAGQRD
ncbi:MAG TPA: hypothetical protein VLE22_07190 [Bryobacteraceae bacterium]|nr:hypothetical protein [Bryobacteraceae bacterium]